MFGVWLGQTDETDETDERIHTFGCIRAPDGRCRIRCFVFARVTRNLSGADEFGRVLSLNSAGRGRCSQRGPMKSVRVGGVGQFGEIIRVSFFFCGTKESPK